MVGLVCQRSLPSAPRRFHARGARPIKMLTAVATVLVAAASAGCASDATSVSSPSASPTIATDSPADPDPPEAFARGFELLSAGRHAEARPYFLAVVAKIPDHPPTL